MQYAALKPAFVILTFGPVFSYSRPLYVSNPLCSVRECALGRACCLCNTGCSYERFFSG